jgi:hypothetical protein
MREVAAFLLDHDHFAGVPPTALVSCHDSSAFPCDGAKVGSLQVSCQYHSSLSISTLITDSLNVWVDADVSTMMRALVL